MPRFFTPIPVYILYLLTCWLGLAHALLFTVQPVSNSVFKGGSNNLVRWIDTADKPSLADMGRVSMDLYVDQGPNNNKYLANLAQDVDARSMSKNVFIPANLWSSASTFYILFTSTHTKPPTMVYTADFTIIGMTGGNGTAKSAAGSTPAAPAAAPAFTGSPSVAIDATASNSTSNTPSSFAMSTTVSTATVSAMMTTDGMTTTSSSSSASVSLPPIAPARAVNAAAARGGRRMKRDSGKVKIDLVFVLWPALFGLAMAL